MNSNSQDPKPTEPSNADQNSEGLAQKLLTGCMFVIAFVAMIFVKPAQFLKKQVYEKDSGRTVAWGAGMLASMAAGIAIGYPLFLAQAAITSWVPLALGAVLLTYFYAWPLLYLALVRWAFESARFLWRNVPVGFSDSAGNNPVWLTRLLAVLMIVATVIGCVVLAWTTGNAFFTWLGWTSTIGNLIAFAVSCVVGVGAGWLAGFIIISLTIEGAMVVLALASGASSAYLLTPTIKVLLNQYELPSWLYLEHVSQALVAFVVAGYLFPLLHVVISRCFNFLGKYLRNFGRYIGEKLTQFVETVYDDKDTAYVGFVRQVANIAIAYGVGQFVFGWAASFGLPVSIALTAVAVLVSYVAVGSLVASVSNVVLGIASAAAAAASIWFVPALQLFSGAWYIVAAQMVVAALATAFVAFPALYHVVKFVANPLLASWLAAPLNSIHKSISREILSAHSNTYSDRTGFEPLFVHVVNIALAVFAYFGASLLFSTLAVGGWVAVLMPVLVVIFSYLFVGKLLLRYSNHLVGTLVGLASGVFAGVQAYAHFGQSYVLGIVFFAAAAVLTGLVVFPVVYVLQRAVINAVSGMNWLLPVLSKVYNFFFGFVDSCWTQFVAAYRRIETSFKPVWQRLSTTWDKSWTNAMAAIDKAWNKTQK